MPRRRSSPAEIADKRHSMIAIIEASARNGHVCPSLHQLAILLRLGTNTVHEMLHSLRHDGVISWSILRNGWSGAATRVVTIKATGAKTAMPGTTAKQRGQPAKPTGPTFIGPPVRMLVGAEFTKRKAELEAKELAAAARK